MSGSASIRKRSVGPLEERPRAATRSPRGAHITPVKGFEVWGVVGAVRVVRGSLIEVAKPSARSPQKETVNSLNP